MDGLVGAAIQWFYGAFDDPPCIICSKLKNILIKGFVGGYDHLRLALNCVLLGIIGSVLLGMIWLGVGGYG